mmetsp:Transcript_62392/g.136384  ORF Transcript_62392/g.136384 Transcript_62392/m.136384 type:complete len:97 (+) Transcript_62392:589-879(+)
MNIYKTQVHAFWGDRLVHDASSSFTWSPKVACSLYSLFLCWVVQNFPCPGVLQHTTQAMHAVHGPPPNVEAHQASSSLHWDACPLGPLTRVMLQQP